MLAVKLLLALAVIGMFVAVWRIESGWKIILTPFLFTIYFEFVRVLPPFFLAETGGVTSIVPLLVAISAFVAVLLGFCASYFYRPTRTSYTRSLSTDFLPKLEAPSNERFGVTIVVLFLVAAGLFFYEGIPPTIHALLGFASGGGGELAAMVTEQRFALTKGAYFGADYKGQGLNAAIQRVGWTLVVCYAVLRWQDLRSRASLFRLFAAFVAAWIFVAGDGTRGAFVNMIMSAVAVFSLRQALRVRTVLWVFVAGVSLGIVLSLYSNKMFQIFTSGDDFLAEAIWRVVERIFLGNGMNDVYVIDLVHRGYFELRLGANHVRDFIAALPGIQAPPPLSYELFQAFNPGSKATTFYSGTYISAVYIDFGWYGTVPIFFLAGCMIGLFQKRLFAVKPTAWSLSVGATAAILAVSVLRSGFIGLGAQLIVLVALVVVHRIGRTVRVRPSHRRQLI